MASRPELTPGDWAVLGVIAERPAHGYAVAQLLGPDGELGRVWSSSRQLVYHSIEKLLQLGLIEIGRTEQDRARTRRVLMATGSGVGLLRAWLDEPVAHVRDVRSELMLKLLLHHRAGSSPTALLRAQCSAVETWIAGLRRQLVEARGFDRTLLRWRLQVAEATLGFLAESLLEVAGSAASTV